uniref:Ribonuclease P protein subunit p29 n=1 Tax=Syphacia muris TaxID=451379 RepID=A0A0N5AUU0_9BILA
MDERSRDTENQRFYVLEKTLVRSRPVRRKKLQNFFNNRITKSQLKDLKYKQFEPLYQLWLEYYESLMNLAAYPDDRLLKADYHGCLFMVTDALNPSQIGLAGILIRETRHTFQLITKADKLITIPKEGTTFQFVFKNQVITLFGDGFKYVFR